MQKFAAVNGFDRRTLFNSPARLLPELIFLSRMITDFLEWQFRASHSSLGLNAYHTSRLTGGAGRNRTADRGFGDLCLTTWLPRRGALCEKTLAQREGDRFWSGRRDLNPRLRPWQGRTLPLSYSRSV